jgi:hypothetical protein
MHICLIYNGDVGVDCTGEAYTLSRSAYDIPKFKIPPPKRYALSRDS